MEIPTRSKSTGLPSERDEGLSSAGKTPKSSPGGQKPPFEVLFRDADFLVVNKPPSMLAVRDRFDYDLPNVHDLLERAFGKVHPVHRLDRETGGALVFALNSEANRDLSGRFERQEVQKTYLALVKGAPSVREGVIDIPLSEVHGKPLTRTDPRHGKPARTEFRVKESFRGLTLLEAMPKTGRQHQIRVHLAHLGIPLAIDSAYGSASELYLSDFKSGFKKGKGQRERPLMSSLTLHAWKIRFFHFRLGGFVEVEAPLPDGFSILLKVLRRWAG